MSSGILVVHQIACDNAAAGPARQIAVAIIDELRAAGPALEPVQEIVLIAGTARDECVAIFVVIRRGFQPIIHVEGGGGARVGKRISLVPGAVAGIVVLVGKLPVLATFVARDQL